MFSGWSLARCIASAKRRPESRSVRSVICRSQARTSWALRMTRAARRSCSICCWTSWISAWISANRWRGGLGLSSDLGRRRGGCFAMLVPLGQVRSGNDDYRRALGSDQSPRPPTLLECSCADPVHRLLHLAMPAVAPLHCIGGRTQQAIVQEGQRLLQVGGLELLEDRLQSLEAADLTPQSGQLRQRRLGTTPAVEQTVDLLHRSPEGPQLRQTPADPQQRPVLSRREVASHVEMTMLEQVPDFPLQVSSPPDLPFRLRRAGAPAGKLRLLHGQVLADLSDGAEDGLVPLRQDVEATDLMLHRAKDRGNRLRIQVRTVGGDPAEDQPAAGQGRLEPPEERPDIPVSRRVVEDLVAQPLEGAVVDDRANAERAVVQLVSGDVPREAVEGPIEVVHPDSIGRLFSPWPPPSSGWWRRGRRPGDRARDANWRSDRASRPLPPTGRPNPRPDRCSGPWARPGRTCRR